MDTDAVPAGRIILLNGASSSGKSSIARALQARLPRPSWHLSIDHLRDAGVLPLDRVRSGEFSWWEMRGPFFAGFEGALPVYARAGNDLVVDTTSASPGGVADRIVAAREARAGPSGFDRMAAAAGA